MNIKIKQNILLKAVDIHRHLVKEIKIEFTEEGIRIFSVDPTHCELAITTIPNTACEEYNVTEGKLEIGIDIQKIKDYLRLFKKDDVIAFGYDSDANRLLGREGNLTRGMGLLDMAGWPDPKIPVVDLKNKLSVNTKIFYNSLKGIMVSKNYEQTYITTTRDSLILENQDDDEDHDKENRSVIMQDTGALTVDCCTTDDNNYTIFRSDFLIKQINEYKKCFDQITIETSPNTPIRITAKNNELEVEYWLAHVTSDEEYTRQQIIEDQEKEPDNEKELKPETEIEKPVEPEIKIIEPLIAELRHGSTDILFYKNEWFWTGDTDHVSKEDIEHNVRIMKQIYDKYSEQVRGLVGVHKDYDKDYVHLHSRLKTKIPNISDEIKIFNGITVKDYYESHEKYDGARWYNFEEQKEEITSKTELREPLEAVKEIVKSTEFDKAEHTDATVNGIEYAAEDINDPGAYSDESQEEYIEKNKDKSEPIVKEIEEMLEKDIKPVINDVYSDRLSICKPRGISYEKHQWTTDMEKIKNMIEKSLKKESKKALSKITDVKGFVFFVVNSTDQVKVDDNTGENIIENLLPSGFVLIAWYRYEKEKWIAQTVEKVR